MRRRLRIAYALPDERVRRVLAEAVGSDLSSKEKHEFLPSVAGQTFLSDGQDRWLSDIERRLFGPGYDGKRGQ